MVQKAAIRGGGIFRARHVPGGHRHAWLARSLHSAHAAECRLGAFELNQAKAGTSASPQTTLAAGAPPTQTRMITRLVCGPHLWDDDVWPVLPDHKTCLGHAGVHGRRVRAPSWPSSPSLRHVSAGHSNDAEEATDTSRSARASRRDVAGQPEPPEALDSSVGAAGTPAAHPLRRESAASYFEEAQLFKTRARVWYVLI